MSSPEARGWDPSLGADHTVFGRGGACATSHPAAVDAGMDVLARGGTAVDAAVSMAAALTVVEPTSNGLGSDAFAIVWHDGKLHGLNGSGRSPAGLDVSAAGAGDEPPPFGWWPVTVPGAPRAWADLHDAFGKLAFGEVLQPAIDLAERGVPVPPIVARFWNRAAGVYTGLKGEEFGAWRATFTRNGEGPRAGEVVALPDHGQTLRAIAESGADAFYAGAIAGRMDAFARETGGYLRGEDLARHESRWVEPLSVAYRDAELWELPPNGQGIVALQALGMLAGEARAGLDDVDALHREIEATKLAFADAQAHVTDAAMMTVPASAFLDPDYLAERRGSIGDRAEVRGTGLPRRGGTVYLAAADRDGMMVSFIQSNYMGFGSGVVVPGTGIALQNRGHGFTLRTGHPNTPAPGKRPFHTIIPGFLTRDGRPWGPIGVMGGHMQPQGHVQVVRALVDGQLPPQSALDRPRWQWTRANQVQLETGWPEAVRAALADRGHEVELAADYAPFGRGQIILRDADGVYAAGSERRADGYARALP